MGGEENEFHLHVITSAYLKSVSQKGQRNSWEKSTLHHTVFNLPVPVWIWPVMLKKNQCVNAPTAPGRQTALCDVL